MAWFHELISPFMIVKCPDGTTRIMYKKIDDVFPLFLGDTSRKGAASVDLTGLGNADLAVETKAAVAQMLVRIGAENSDLAMKLRACYAAYQTNPCANATRFNQHVEQIVAHHTELTRMGMRFQTLITLAATGKMDNAQTLEALNQIQLQLPSAKSDPPPAVEMQNARGEMALLTQGSTQ